MHSQIGHPDSLQRALRFSLSALHGLAAEIYVSYRRAQRIKLVLTNARAMLEFFDKNHHVKLS